MGLLKVPTIVKKATTAVKNAVLDVRSAMIIREARKKLEKEEKRRSIIAELTRPLSWYEGDELDFSFSTTRGSRLYNLRAIQTSPVIKEEDETMDSASAKVVDEVTEVLESASVKTSGEVAATSTDTGSSSEFIGDTTITSAERTEVVDPDKISKLNAVVYVDASTHMERKGCQGCCWCIN